MNHKIKFPLKGKGKPSEIDSVSIMMEGLKKLKDIKAIEGELDEILVNYTIDESDGFAVAELKEGSLKDSSKLNTIGGWHVFNTDPKDLEEASKVEQKEKSFSIASIKDRLRLAQYDPKMKFRRTIMDYKRFYSANQSKVLKNRKTAIDLKNLFLIDMMGMFNEILPYIEEGKQLGTLIGVTNVTEGMNTVSRDLSVAYRRSLKQVKNGQLSKNLMNDLRKTYASFMDMLIPQVFPGLIEFIRTGKSDAGGKFVRSRRGSGDETLSDEEGLDHELLDRAASYSDSGSLTNFKISTNCERKLTKVLHFLDQINSKFGNGEVNKLEIKATSKDVESVLELDIDQDEALILGFNKEDDHHYSITNEGRVRLF